MVADIEAGQAFSTIIDVEFENSIICISMKTLDYDLKIGLFKATHSSKFQHNVQEENANLIEHSTTGDNGLQEVIALQNVDSSQAKTINFVAKQTGMYKLVFSNEHSWMRGKSLMYRYSVLRPTDEEIERINAK